MKVGVARETAPGERRVALVPDAIGKLTAAGLEILIESGAGAGAQIPDGSFADVGAHPVSTTELYATADVILRVQKPQRRRDRPAAPGPDRHRPPPAAHRPGHGQGPRRPRRDRHQPRRPAAHPEPRPGHGRALVAGQRGRLQGRPHRRRRLRPLLPAADHRRRHGQARQRADPGHRRGRPAGHRHGPAAGRRRQGLRRPCRDQGAGGVARRPVPGPQVGRRRLRRGRLRAGPDARRAGRAAGGAQRLHRPDGRRDHHRPGARPTTAGAGDSRGGAGHATGLGHRRHGGQRPRRQRRAVEGRRDGRHRQRRHDRGARQPAGHDAGRRVRLLRPQHLDAPAAPRQGRGAGPGPADEITAATVITQGGRVVQAATAKLLEPPAAPGGASA